MQKDFLLIFCYSLFSLPVLQAQYTLNDSVSSRPSNQTALAFYFKTLGENAPVYNGSEYVNYGQNMVGSPFFASDSMQKATLEYDGTVYFDIPIKYDLVSDDIIIEDYRRNYYIKLVKEKVNRFYVHGHEFIRLKSDSSVNFLVEDGFYDRIYKGNISVFVKRTKWIGYATGIEKITYTFRNKTGYFVLKENGWFKITDKASLMETFGNKKNDARQYYRSNHLNFKKDPEHTVLKMISYYDHLKN